MSAESRKSSSRSSSRICCAVAVFTKRRPAVVLLGPALESGLVDGWRRRGGGDSNHRRHE
jgi:hypothetical protein